MAGIEQGRPGRADEPVKLRVALCDYVLLGKSLAVVRLKAELPRGASAPAYPLLQMTRGVQRIVQPGGAVALDRVPGRLWAPSRTVWKVCFAATPELVEAAEATFELFDGPDRLLVAPHPELRAGPGPSEAELRLWLRELPTVRQLTALATVVTVTAASTPGLAAAAESADRGHSRSHRAVGLEQVVRERASDGSHRAPSFRVVAEPARRHSAPAPTRVATAPASPAQPAAPASPAQPAASASPTQTAVPATQPPAAAAVPAQPAPAPASSTQPMAKTPPPATPTARHRATTPPPLVLSAPERPITRAFKVLRPADRGPKADRGRRAGRRKHLLFPAPQEQRLPTTGKKRTRVAVIPADPAAPRPTGGAPETSSVHPLGAGRGSAGRIESSRVATHGHRRGAAAKATRGKRGAATWRAIPSAPLATITPTPPVSLSAAPSGLTPATEAALARELRLLAATLRSGDQPPLLLIHVYKAAARRYHVPWKALAAINAVETDYGRDLAVSSAGAIGWMQFMPDTWREFATTPSGRGVPNPFDPRDAIFSAARFLAAHDAAHDLPQALFAYNHAAWYVDEVLWKMRTISDRAGRIHVHGVPATVARLIAAGNAIATDPYVWGGGHASFLSNGYDCSGSVSFALGAAGLLKAPQVSGDFESYGEPGPGKWVTIYANRDHVWMTVAGWRFDTVALAQSGTRWAPSGGEFAGFVVRHPAGL